MYNIYSYEKKLKEQEERIKKEEREKQISQRKRILYAKNRERTKGAKGQL